MKKNIFSEKNQSIMKKLFIPMIIVMVIQTLLFSCVILWGGTIDNLNKNALDILNERVINRKNYLENEMAQRYSNIDESVKKIGETVQNTLNSQNAQVEMMGTNEALKEAILLNNADNLVYTLRKNAVTGAFLILTENDKKYDLGVKDATTKSVLYIRDSDPGTEVEDLSDLSIERSPVNVAKSLDITMSSLWETQLIFSGNDPNQSDFYYKPLRALRDYPDLSYNDLGYWSKPFIMSKDQETVITYSVPLKTKDGKVYGVFGIELSKDYLYKNLPSNELDKNNNASYLLAVNSDATRDNAFTNIVTSGTAYKRIAGDTDSTLFSEVPFYNNTYALEKSTSIKEEALGCIQPLKLYNTNTPFVNDQWALIGVINQNSLFEFSHRVIKMVLWAMVISLIIGIFGIFIAGTMFTKPIKTLVNQVKASNPRKPVLLDKTNIKEMDELGDSIEKLSLDVADSASKLSRIISIAGVPIGAFEYNKKANEVFYTNCFFNILNLENDGSMGYMSSEKFRQSCEKMKIYSEESDEEKDSSIFEIIDKAGKSKWIKIKKVEDENGILGVIRDVTVEKLDRLKIEHERDFDILTNLLNRQAFYLMLSQKFEQPETLKTAAILMMDLDNLKYINDTYGHNFGDEYIKSTARVLRKFASNNVIFARISGDEFYALIYGYESKAPIRELIASIQEKLMGTVFPLLNDPNFKIRASGGVTWYPDDSCIYEDLVKYADFTMYEMKKTVKGTFGEFSMRRYNDSVYQHEKEKDLNKLIDEKMIDYVFQPIVETKTGCILGYEAFMRSDLTVIKSPFDILALAKSQGKLHQIEKLTWFSVMKVFKEKIDAFGEAKLFINSIANQFLKPEEQKRIEEMYGSLLNRVVIEMSKKGNFDSTLALEKLECSRNWGGSLVLEDLDINYNDTDFLFITPNYVKIDMSIVQNVDQEKNRRKLLQNMIAYFKEKKIKIIAEGVETVEELKILIQFGVDYVQGYYLAMPNSDPPQLSQKQIDEMIKLNKEINVR
ncbi:MAG: EAL domain-containing protein [Eubacterium sp.]